ncbi:MAG: metallophosphoesterase [Nevskia sp.]|nr:metallophosphoesterase [Nevskia sp.]
MALGTRVRLAAATLSAGLALAAVACQAGGNTSVPASLPANGTVATSGLNTPTTLSFGNTAQNIQKIQAVPFSGHFTFTFMGDNRDSSPFTSDGEKVYQQVIAKINQIRPDFAVNDGDFTYEGLLEHWQTFEQLTGAVQVPFLTVIGNHDAVLSRTYYELNYTPANPVTGLDDYTFTYGNTRFIALDDANQSISPAQFTWLHQQLTAPGVQNTIVMAHIPPSYGNWTRSENLGAKDSSAFMELMAQDHASLVLLSHTHLFDGSVSYKGVPYVVSGGAGADLDTPGWGQSLYHITQITVDGQHITWEMIPVAASAGQPVQTKQVR